MQIYTKEERASFKTKRIMHSWIIHKGIKVDKILVRARTINIYIDFEILKSRSLIITIYNQLSLYRNCIYSNHNKRLKIFYFPNVISDIDNELNRIMDSCFKRNKFINIEIRRMLVRTIKRLYRKA